MFSLQVKFKLNQITCFDEADSLGAAEPYLWTVFFKVDGETAKVTDDGKIHLSGTGIVKATPGSHGNLGTRDVSAGGRIPIPAALGEWESRLIPIPVPDSLKTFFPNGIGGIIGVICILMEEDNVTDSGAEAGHRTLNEEVQKKLNAIIPTITLQNTDPSDEIDKIEGEVREAIENAIQDHQNIFENLWSFLNADDTIGVKTFMFSHDDLIQNSDQIFSQRWKNEGDWSISGAVHAVGGGETDVLVTIDKVKFVDTVILPPSVKAPAFVSTQLLMSVNGETRRFPNVGVRNFPNNQLVDMPDPEYTFLNRLHNNQKLRIQLQAKLSGQKIKNPIPPPIFINISRDLQVINEFRKGDNGGGNPKLPVATGGFGEGIYTVKSNVSNSAHFEVVYRIRAIPVLILDPGK